MNLQIKYKTLFSRYGLSTKLRISHFLAQIGHESGFIARRESVYYTTVEGLRKTFYSPFKKKSDAFVSQYLRNSEKCANYVYANRMGNGNEASGDGYKFRGGGLLQNTGKNQFKWLTEVTGIDFIGNPNLIIEEVNALIAALEYWKANNLNRLADKDDLDGISDIVNIGRETTAYGDSNGFAHRKILLNHFKTEVA
jgi:putative chitinase